MEEVISRLSKVLAFPEGFFSEPDIDGPPGDTASFRSMSAISAKERDAALAAGTLAYIVSDWVEQRFDLPKPDLLDLSGDTPEVAAVSLREKWSPEPRRVEVRKDVDHGIEPSPGSPSPR